MDMYKRLLRTLLKLALGRGVRKSYGQHGEDALIAGELKWVKKGVYVDVGAYDPVLYSNTFALYKNGWSGVVIDANPDMCAQYAWLRPRDRFVNVAVGTTPGTKKYYMFSDGAYNSFDEERAKRWERERHLPIRRVLDVPFKPLATILKEHAVSHIDFLNVDVEGLDLEVLTTHDWSILPRVIAVEDDAFDAAHPQTSPVYAYLVEKGYVLAGLAGLTLIFKRPKL